MVAHCPRFRCDHRDSIFHELFGRNGAVAVLEIEDILELDMRTLFASIVGRKISTYSHGVISDKM